jgi:uncharacterized Zn finger protein
MDGFAETIHKTRDVNRVLEYVTRVGKGLRVLIDTSEPTRLERAESILDRVQPIHDSLTEIAASVKSSDGLESYAVVITFGYVARGACECPDFGRTGPCKHVLAVGLRWLDQVARPVYRELRQKRRHQGDSSGCQ